MKITLEQLVLAGACENQVRKFRKLFGDSVTVTKERCLKYVDVFCIEWFLGLNSFVKPSYIKKFYKKSSAAKKEYDRKFHDAYWSNNTAVRKIHSNVGSDPWTEAHSIRLFLAEAKLRRTTSAALKKYNRVKALAFYEACKKGEIK